MTQVRITQDFHKPTLTIDGNVTVPMLYGLSDFPAASERCPCETERQFF